jgi:hypothetical protein
LAFLTRGLRYAELGQPFESVDLSFIDPATHKILQAFLEGGPARDDDADGNSPLRMKPLEILQIAIEKRILVVPFDFERDPISLSIGPVDNANVVNLVGG